MSDEKVVFEGGVEYRVFKEVIDLENGQSIEMPEYVIPLTVQQKTPTAVCLWFLCPVGETAEGRKSEAQP